MNSQLVNIFVVEGQYFALPISQIIRIVRAVELTRVPQAPAGMMGVMDYHGTLLPVMSMRTILGMIPKNLNAEDRFLIVHTNYRDVVLVADSVGELLDISGFNRIEGKDMVPGTSLIEMVYGQKGLIFIYDLESLFRLDDHSTYNRMLEIAGKMIAPDADKN